MRVDEQRSADAYRRGLWVSETLADSLRDAAQATPDRTVLVDGDVRLDCKGLHEQATALAAALMARMPAGSVVSFMLPNWHEAAIIYLGATLAGMVVNPILPSLRDRELAFILSDADSRVIFVPSTFGNHDYAAMLDRVTAPMSAPPQVVVVRGERGPPHPLLDVVRRADASGAAGAEPRHRAHDPLHLRHDRTAERCSAHPQFDPRADPSDRRALAGVRRRYVPGAVADRAHRRIDLRLRMSRCCWARRRC